MRFEGDDEVFEFVAGFIKYGFEPNEFTVNVNESSQRILLKDNRTREQYLIEFSKAK